MSKLSATFVKQVKPEAKTKKYFDGHGLYLEVKPNGSKLWRHKYRFEGKEKLLSLGSYPEISLAEARDRHREARSLIAKEVDPSQVRQAKKEAQSDINSFEAIAREWHAKQCNKWTERHAQQVMSRLEKKVFPWIGKIGVQKIEAPDLAKITKRIEDKGAYETAHRVLGVCSQVLKYAVKTGRAKYDVSYALKGSLTPTKPKHLPSITDPVEIGALLRAIDEYQGTFIVKSALKLAPLVFVRPKELRMAEWSEFNMATREWRIPAEKMKARREHIVPLSRQAVEVIEELRPLTGEGAAAKYLFPNPSNRTRCMSDNAVLCALRRMGYEKEEMTGHGFRSMASTRLHEMGYVSDHIELQLAHTIANSTKAAYNYALHLEARAKMMQEWADYLDELKAGGEVIKASFGG